MAVESDINSKYPKTVSLRKLLDKEKEKVTFLWCQAIWEYQEMKSQTEKQKLPLMTTHYPKKKHPKRSD
jgi:hypothetical protein